MSVRLHGKFMKKEKNNNAEKLRGEKDRKRKMVAIYLCRRKGKSRNAQGGGQEIKSPSEVKNEEYPKAVIPVHGEYSCCILPAEKLL